MNKYGIVFLLLVVLGLGYWLSVSNIGDVLKVSDTKEASLPVESAVNTPETATQEPITNGQDQNIINKEENKKIMTVTLKTNKGDITIEFNPNTPKTVENFIKLAESGFYDGTKFHRIIKGFMSQGGDPLSKDDTKENLWGTGGPEYKFDDELTSSNKNDIGTIAMANSGPNTNGSQFFINAATNNFLDTKHTVFAKITVGLDVAEKINSVKTDSSDRPIEPIILQSITLK
ncbi:MAG: peptidylprolyl isomerase [Candidatus Paceibacterota bacterium]